jgi:simple sugar transport system permease protein
MSQIDALRPTTTDRGETAKMRLLRSALAVVDAQFIWLLLAVLILLASFSSPFFLTPMNGFNILIASASLGCLVIAQSFVLILGRFDLSTEANMVFVAILGTLVMAHPAHQLIGAGVVVRGGLGMPWELGIAAMLLAGATIGLINGLMIVVLRMNAFMVTLAVSIVLGGLALVISEGQTLFDIPDAFRYVGSESIGAVPVAAVFLILIFVVVHFTLSNTPFGKQMYAVGGNREAARAAGINDDLILILGYVLSGLFCGLAAFLLVGRLGTASAGISNGALFLSVAGAVIGGVSLFGGRGTAPGMLGGLLIISVISNAMNLAAIPGNMIRVVSGSAILFAVLVDALRVRRLPGN